MSSGRLDCQLPSRVKLDLSFDIAIASTFKESAVVRARVRYASLGHIGIGKWQKNEEAERGSDSKH